MSDDKIRIKSFYAHRDVDPDRKNEFDYVQLGIWDENYEYFGLDELLLLRKFVNDTIIKMTFKTTKTK